MAFSLPRSVASSSRTNIPVMSVARRSSNPLVISPSARALSNPEPNVNTLSDEYLILTRKRHSDFHPITTSTDHRQAGQFLRWKEWNLKNQSMLKTKMIDSGDFLTAGHAAAAEEFPRAGSGAIANAAELLESQIFKLQLLEPLSSQEDVSLGFRCRLVSVGDTVLASTPTPSKLYVKLYDDRFFPLPTSIWYKPGDRHASAEDYIRGELAAYEAGHVARRWKCHGAFKFVLSRNGHWLNGLLWEDLGQ